MEQHYDDNPRAPEDVPRDGAEETGDGADAKVPPQLSYDLFLNYNADDKHTTVPTLNASIGKICVRSSFKLISDSYNPYDRSAGPEMRQPYGLRSVTVSA